MKQFMNRASLITLTLGALLGIVFCAGMYAGIFFQPEKEVGEKQRTRLTPEMVLNAESAASGQKISLATGLVSEGNEGLFALDHTTGDLFCWMINPRQVNSNDIRFHVEYYINVYETLQLDKGEEADLVMTMGRINTAGMQNINNARPSQSVCYVADGNTGRVAGFSFYFNKTLLAAKTIQRGPMVPITAAVTRGNIQRD